jgi:hypothetical protein
MLVLYKDGALVGSTEFITDNLNPKWITSFNVEYDFSKVSTFLAVIYDIEDPENLQ